MATGILLKIFEHTRQNYFSYYWNQLRNVVVKLRAMCNLQLDLMEEKVKVKVDLTSFLFC